MVAQLAVDVVYAILIEVGGQGFYEEGGELVVTVAVVRVDRSVGEEDFEEVVSCT